MQREHTRDRARSNACREFKSSIQIKKPNHSGSCNAASNCCDQDQDGVAQDRDLPATNQGHFATGGIELRMLSTLPPVFRPNVVPRS
jgi:hypothetical protein